MEEDTLRNIESKLDVLIKLSAGNLIKGTNKTDAILILGLCGLDVNTIADIVGTTNQTVSVRLSEQKKKGSTDKKKR
jgi:DNA-binding NarL/FixJ family response regulator